ncbi:MAG: hypothetical protein R3F49_16515 [Planctomycetota bacterium]
MDLATGWVTLRCGPHVAVDLASVPRAVREAGFAPSELRLVARGALEGDGDAFRIDGWTFALPLEDAGGDWRAALARGQVLRAQVVGWDVEAPVALVPLVD